MNTKICPKCKKKYSATREFFYGDKRNPDGLTYLCKNCRKKYRNKEKLKQLKRRYHLKRFYGITEKDYNKLFNKYNGRCWICGRHQCEFKNKLHIDHNHITNQIRGLLCANCNKTLGLFNDNPLIFIKMTKYLIKNGSKF